MDAAEYDAWYGTPRGRWIGETEFTVASTLLGAQSGASLLDVGCGTGWFTRRFAAQGLCVCGLDPDPQWLGYARAHGDPSMTWVEGDARALPFADGTFEHVASIAAFCFIDDERKAAAEAVRVARRSFVIGWLNRRSLLYLQKGRDGGSGAYRGARWHTAEELRLMFKGLNVHDLKVRSAVVLPTGARLAVAIERFFSAALPFGAMLLVSGTKASDTAHSTVATEQVV